MVNTLRRVKERARENNECSSSRDEAQKASFNSSTLSKPRVSNTAQTLWLFMITSTVQSPAFFTYCIPACYDLIRSHGKRAGFKATPYHSITIKVIFKASFSRDISIPRYSWCLCDRSVVCAVKFLHITTGFQGQSSQASGACRPRIPILTAQWLIPSWFTLKFDVWFLKGLRFVISL